MPEWSGKFLRPKAHHIPLHIYVKKDLKSITGKATFFAKGQKRQCVKIYFLANKILVQEIFCLS